MVSVVVLHAPWEGYHFVSDGSVHAIDSEATNQVFFWFWSSQAPLLPWFGPIWHAFIALVAISLVMAAWVYLFDSARGAPEKPDQTPE